MFHEDEFTDFEEYESLGFWESVFEYPCVKVRQVSEIITDVPVFQFEIWLDEHRFTIIGKVSDLGSVERMAQELEVPMYQVEEVFIMGKMKNLGYE